MVTATISITEADLFHTLGNFLTYVLPSGTPVVKAQTNRVAEPANTNFVTMTPSLRQRLGFNWTEFSDGYPSTASVQTDNAPTDVSVQLDIHGPLAADNLQILTTLFWSGWGCDQFATSGFDITPLWCSTPVQAPFLNAEQQIETRWTVDFHMQVNAVVTITQQFAAALDVELVSVEAVYHP